MQKKCGKGFQFTSFPLYFIYILTWAQNTIYNISIYMNLSSYLLYLKKAYLSFKHAWSCTTYVDNSLLNDILQFYSEHCFEKQIFPSNLKYHNLWISWLVVNLLDLHAILQGS